MIPNRIEIGAWNAPSLEEQLYDFLMIPEVLSASESQRIAMIEAFLRSFQDAAKTVEVGGLESGRLPHD
jgi:hypothetical protein